MPTDTDLLTLAQWFSPAFPLGAFSFSHGLETAVQEGSVTDAAGFDFWLRDLLEHGSGRNDAILLCAAYRAPDAAARAEIDALARALAPSRERLLEMDELGGAFGRTVAAIWQVPAEGACYPVAVGAAAAHAGLALRPTLQLYLQAFAGNLTSAAIRLVPLGQTEGHALLAGAAPICMRLAAEAEDSELDDLGSCAFLADIASMKHETLYSRLFRS